MSETRMTRQELVALIERTCIGWRLELSHNTGYKQADRVIRLDEYWLWFGPGTISSHMHTGKGTFLRDVVALPQQATVTQEPDYVIIGWTHQAHKREEPSVQFSLTLIKP